MPEPTQDVNLSTNDWAENDWGDSSDSTTDLSFLETNKATQRLKSANGQANSEYAKIVNAREEWKSESEINDIFNSLPEYLQDSVIKIDKKNNPDSYEDEGWGDEKEYVKKSDINKILKETLEDYDENADNRRKTKDDFDKVKTSIPKTLSSEQNNKLQKYFEKNIQDWINKTRALKLAIQDAWIDISKNDNDWSLPPKGNKAPDKSVNKKIGHNWEKAKFLRD